MLYFNCVVAVCGLCSFLTVPWVSIQSVIVANPGHTQLLFHIEYGLDGTTLI